MQIGLGGSGDVEAGRVGQVILAALATAAVIAILMAANAPSPGGPLTPSGMTRARPMLIALAGTFGLTIAALAGAGWLHTHLGIPLTLTKGIAAGAPGGVFGGWALRLLRR